MTQRQSGSMSRRMFHKTSSVTLAMASMSRPSALRAAAREDTEGDPGGNDEFTVLECSEQTQRKLRHVCDRAGAGSLCIIATVESWGGMGR